MRKIETEIVIDAPPGRVWKVLADFASHADWDPFMASLAGETAVGGKLEVKFRNGMTFRPTVTELREGQVLEWFGKLLFGGIFDGRHRFELVSEGEKTKLIHSEQFSGVLVPLMGGMLETTKSGFVAFNEAIKQRVEAST